MNKSLTAQEREDLISQLRLNDELELRVKQNRLEYFTPNGAQEEFISKVGSGDIFIGILSSANGTGKTALMANILANIIYGPQTKWFDHPLFKNFKFPKRARIASTSKNVEEIGAIQTEIKKWFPKGKYDTFKRGKTYDCEYIIGDWVTDIMTYKQDVSEYESATLGVCIFDEPPPLPVLHACIARMRKGGIILIFMTPLDTGGQIIEDLTSKAILEYEGETVGKVYLQYADIETNCQEHGVRGTLTHKDIMIMMNFFDPEEREARAKGKPTHIIGRIYPEFDNTEPHVVDDFIIPEDWYRFNILDPHDAIPYALSWVAMDKTGELWVYDEFPFDDLEKLRTTNLSIPDYASIIYKAEGRFAAHTRIIDPFFGNKRYSNTGKTVRQELADVGLDYENGDTSGLDLGHKKIGEYLHYDKRFMVSATNHPRLHIMKKCRNHWRSLLRYRKKIHKSGEVKDKIVIDETYKHFCDNLRHLIMRDDLNMFQQKAQEGSVSYRVVGPMKDIKFTEEDETPMRKSYHDQSQGRFDDS